jgi:hypothetical protein
MYGKSRSLSTSRQLSREKQILPAFPALNRLGCLARICDTPLTLDFLILPTSRGFVLLGVRRLLSCSRCHAMLLRHRLHWGPDILTKLWGWREIRGLFHIHRLLSGAILRDDTSLETILALIKQLENIESGLKHLRGCVGKRASARMLEALIQETDTKLAEIKRRIIQ